MKYAVSVHVLWGITQKKNRAAKTLRVILKTLGEWTRIKHSMTKLRQNIITLQRGARQFLALKRRRCDIMAKEWARVEDKFLDHHFTLFAEKLMNDDDVDKAKSKKHKRDGDDGLSLAMQKAKSKQNWEKISKMMKEHVNWWQYRIPQQEKYLVLSRYYVVNLKKKIQSTEGVMVAVRGVVAYHRETMGFLKEFGVSESQVQDMKSMATQRIKKKSAGDFWHLTEDVALNLIAFAAYKMPDEEPWRNHPSIREIRDMDNLMYRPACKATSEEAFLEVMGFEQPKRGRDRKGLGGSTSLKSHEKVAEKRVDVDELWNSFTPRLRATSEKPMSPEWYLKERPSSRPGLGAQDQAACSLVTQEWMPSV